MLAGTEFTHKKKERKSSEPGFEPGSFAPKAITLTVRLERPQWLPLVIQLVKVAIFSYYSAVIGVQQT